MAKNSIGVPCEFEEEVIESVLRERNSMSIPLTLEQAEERIKELFGNEKPRSIDIKIKDMKLYNFLRLNGLLESITGFKKGLADTEDNCRKKFKEFYGDKKVMRSKILKENNYLYFQMRKHNLLDELCPKKKPLKLKSDKELRDLFNNKYKNIVKGRTQLQKKSMYLYLELSKRGMLDELCPKRERKVYVKKGLRKTMSFEEILKRYDNLFKEKPTKKELRSKDKELYLILRHKKILNNLTISYKDEVIRELKKYAEEIGYVPTMSSYCKLFKRDSEKIYKRFNKGFSEIIKEVFGKDAKSKVINKAWKKKLTEKEIKEQKEEAIKKYHKIYKEKPLRGKLGEENHAIYHQFLKHNLLDKYCLLSKLLTLKQTIKKYHEIYKEKPRRGQLQKENHAIYHQFLKHNLLDKYCLLPYSGFRINKNLKITSTYKPITIIPTNKKKKGKKGNGLQMMKQDSFKTTEDKINIREKIISNINDNDLVLLLESPELSAIKEIEKQNKKPRKIVIPNNKEFKKLAEKLREYKTDLQIELINTTALQYLVDSKEKFDFIWLDYCGAFSYYVKDLDILFAKHLDQMKLILTYNLFDPAKEDDSYYFTRVIDYVLNKVSGKNKIRLINDITYRYKKQMYNIGFNIQNLN